jgi:hypothetical protein
MLFTFLLIAALLAVGLSALAASLRLRQQLWHALRTRWLISGLVTLYGVIAGMLLVTGFNSPRMIFLLALPVVAGVCGIWWELRQEAVRPVTERILERGVLAGLILVVLPLLCIAIGQVWLAWRSGDLAVVVATWTAWEHILPWVAGILGTGVVIGVLGTFVGIWLTELPGPRHRG